MRSPCPPDETVGDPAKARHHIQIGWSYDEANQKNPAMLTGPIEAVQGLREEERRGHCFGGDRQSRRARLEIGPAAAKDRHHAPGVVVDGRTIADGAVFLRCTSAHPGHCPDALDSGCTAQEVGNAALRGGALLRRRLATVWQTRPMTLEALLTCA